MVEEAKTVLPGTRPKSGENFWLWFYKQVTGPVILILIIVHFVVNHLIPEGALLTHEGVVNYYQIWFVPFMEALFLILVVSHSLLGLRSIILDLNPSRGTLRVLDVAFIVIGVVSSVYGIWLIRAILQQG